MIHVVTGVTQCFMVLIRCHRVLHGLTGCYTVLHGVMMFHGVTRCFMVLHGVRG